MENTNKTLTPLNLLEHGFKTFDYHVFEIKGCHRRVFCINLLQEIVYVQDVEKGVIQLYPKNWNIESIKRLYFLIFHVDLSIQTNKRLDRDDLLYLGFERTDKVLEFQRDFPYKNIRIKVSLHGNNLGVVISKYHIESSPEKSSEHILNLVQTNLFKTEPTLQALREYAYAITGNEIDHCLDNYAVYDFLHNKGFQQSKDANFTWFIKIYGVVEHTLQYNHKTRTAILSTDKETIFSKNLLNIQTTFESLIRDCEIFCKALK